MSTAVDLKTKEEKDAELDRRIEALRKKNEALVRRYQEIQEDKKKAEQEGIAVTTPRKPRPHEADTDRRRTEKENITVTVDVSKTGEKRVISEKKAGTPRSGLAPEEGEPAALESESSPRRAGSGRLGRGMPWAGPRHDRREPRQNKVEPGHGRTEAREERTDLQSESEPWEGEGPEGQTRQERVARGGRRGRGGASSQGAPGSDRKSREREEKRRQNIEKVNEEMEKIAEYERGQRGEGDKNPVRNFLDDPRRCGPIPEVDRKEGSRRHVRNWGGVDFDNVKTGPELDREWTGRRPVTKGSVDMTMSMTGRERAEYLRWKKEREQIDEERLARHRNATGQWKREWDAQKTESMFKEEPPTVIEGGPDHGGRREENARPPRAPTFGDFLGHGKPKEAPFGGRGRGKGRGQGKAYSMHDDRWEGQNDTEKEEEKMPPQQQVPVKEKVDVPVEKSADAAGEEDDDEWEDASDDDDVVVEGGGEEEEEEEVQEGLEEHVEKSAEPLADKTEKSGGSSPPAVPAVSPKEQRTPRPKVHMPPQQGTPEPSKPLSPFSPLEGHRTVMDWSEEMEMQSPGSSLGESPLKPDSEGAEGSPSKAEERPESQDPVPAVEQDLQVEGDQGMETTKAEEGVLDMEPQSQESPLGEPDELPCCPSEDLEDTPAPVSQEPLLSSKDEAEDLDASQTTSGTDTVTGAPEQPSSG